MKNRSRSLQRFWCRGLTLILALVSAGICGRASPEVVAQGQSPTGGQPMVKKRAFLEGHIGEYVRCVAFSPDGKTLASGSDDKTLKLWEVATGEEKATLRGHTNEVWYAAFLPDGKTVMSGSLDGSARLWDVAAGTQKGSLRCFVPSPDYIGSPSWALSPEGKTLAFVQYEEEAAILFDLETRKERRRLKGHWGRVAFSHNGKTLALVGGEGLELRDVVSGEAKVTLKGEFGPVAFSPDNKTLVADSDAGKVGVDFVKVVEVGTGRLKASFKVETDEEGIISLAFSPDGKTLAVGRYLGGLQLWDVTTGTLKVDVPPAADAADNTQFANSLAFSPDGKILAAGGSTTGLPREKGIVRLWDIAGKP